MTWDGLYIGKVLFDKLNGLQGIATRIYPMRIPQNIDLATTAAISYYLISTSPETTKDSRSMVDTLRVQVSIFAPTYSTLNTIAQLTRDALDGLHGEVAGASIDGFYFSDETDLFEDEHKIYHRAQDYIVRVKNNASSNPSTPVSETITISADYGWAIIPAGYLLEYMIFDETTGHTGQLSAGTSAGTANIFRQEAINGGGLTVVNINKAYAAAITIYINHSQDEDDWAGMTVNVYAQLRKFV